MYREEEVALVLRGGWMLPRNPVGAMSSPEKSDVPLLACKGEQSPQGKDTHTTPKPSSPMHQQLIKRVPDEQPFASSAPLRDKFVKPNRLTVIILTS